MTVVAAALALLVPLTALPAPGATVHQVSAPSTVRSAIQAQTVSSAAIAPISAAEANQMWNAYGSAGGHWTGGDTTVSVPLPDGRVVWLFSDTFLGKVRDDGSRPRDEDKAPFIHNSLVVQSHGELVRTVHGGTDRNPQSLVGPTTGDHFYWVGDGYVDDGVLRVFYNKYVRTGNEAWEFKLVGTSLATFSLDDFSVLSLEPLPVTDKAAWGTSIIQRGGYSYIYGTGMANGFKSTFLARVPGTDVASGQWQFWTGDGWSTNEAAAKRLVSGTGSAWVSYIDGQYVLVTQEVHQPFNPWFVAYTSKHPWGPFHGPEYLFKADEPSATNDLFVYDAVVHLELSTPGKLLISYNVNSFDAADLYRDASIYRPTFVDVPWPQPQPDPSGVPDAPTNVSVEISDGVATVSWDAVPGATSYWVYQRDATAKQTHFVRVRSTTATSVALGPATLTGGHTYEWHVRAVNKVGEGTPSNTVGGTMSFPDPPRNLTATAADGKVHLDWDASPTPGVKYYVYYGVKGSSTWFYVKEPVKDKTRYTMTGLSNGTTYKFKISAANDAYQAYTKVVEATPVPPPEPPRNLMADPGDDTVYLDWDPSVTPGVHYWVYYSPEGQSAWYYIKKVEGRTEYTVTEKVANGFTYEFKVSAANEAGQAYTKVVTAQPSAPATLATATNAGRLPA